MAIKVGLVGYQGSGKSTLFEWLTQTPADPSLSHASQSAMATVVEPRIGQLCEIYKPKKVTQASLEIVDTPGLARDHEGSAQKLSVIREAGCLCFVVTAFGGQDPAAELESFEEDLFLADHEIVSGRVSRLRESVKKPRPNRDEELAELEALEPLLAKLDQGEMFKIEEMTTEQRRATRSFQLFTEKPRMVIINTADDEENPDRFAQLGGDNTTRCVSLSLQVELSQMEEEERAMFCEEMGVEPIDREPLIRDLLAASGQMLFFTAGEKEVRSWMIHRGGTAVEAADNIHTDLARGFIRAATFSADDLIRLGSEREVKAANLVRQEPRDYVIQDGDVIEIRHN